MSKTKIIKPYKDEMSMMMRRDLISETGAYETVKSTNSSMDDTCAHVIE